MYSRKNIYDDIFIVILFVLLTAIFVLVAPLDTTWVRTVLGLPMVLFFPGYALIAALFPGKDDLDGIERIALSFGLSIAVVPLLGLGLNYTPWGIRLIPILITLAVFTLVMCVIAIMRRSHLSDSEAFQVQFKAFYQSLRTELFTRPESTVDRVLTVILVISILVSVIISVYVIVTPKQGEKFTEFYILGPDGIADDYPTQMTQGESGTVIVGIVNHEFAVVNYSLGLMLDNESLFNDRKIVSLAHNETWQQPVTFMPKKAGTDMKLQFVLYKEYNYTAPYRDAHLWIDVLEGPDGV
jgi:uncharacterized membrane protein